MKKEVKFVLAIVLCMVFFSASSQAVNYYWMNPGQAGNAWNNAAGNWGSSTYVPILAYPTTGDGAFIYKAKECIIGTDMVGAAKALATSVYIGGGIANTNAFLTIKGEAAFATSLNLGWLAAATNSRGTLKIEPGAVVTVPTFVIGYAGAAPAYSTIGDVNMLGGAVNLSVTNPSLTIGAGVGSNGILTMNGGTITAASQIRLAWGSTGKAKVIVNNGAFLNGTAATSNFYVGAYGLGELEINSGGKVKTLTGASLQVGVYSGTPGGTGHLTMNGGTLEIGSNLYVSNQTPNDNWVQLNNDANVTIGGQLLMASGGTGTAKGRMTIAGSAAKVKVAGTMTLGHATPTTGTALIELQAGTLTGLGALTINSAGKINITGGTLILPISQLATVNACIGDGRIYSSYGNSRCIKVAATATQVIVTADLSVLKMASNPIPADGNVFSALSTADISLQWSPGEGAVSHDVYLGSDYNDVNNADNTDTTGIYQGNQLGTTFNFNPHILRPSTVYWRVDEFDGAAVWKGRVWKLVPAFSTPASSYAISNKIVSTTVFHWYTSTGGQLSGPWLPLDGRANWTGEPDWWKSQIKQMMMANIQVLYVHLLPVMEQQRINFFQALYELRMEGYDVPKIIPFLNLLTPIDAATTAGKDAFAAEYIRFYNQYYSKNTDAFADNYLATIGGKVVTDVWLLFNLTNYASLTRADVESRLQTAFAAAHPVFNNGIYMVASAFGPTLGWANELIQQFEVTPYFQTKAYNGITTATIKGGFWNQNIGTPENPGTFMARDGGSHYHDAWTSVLADSSIKRAYVESWNEYDEGSGIYAVDVVNSPYRIPANTNNDTWSSINDPYEYIRTTAEGARQFNGITDYNSAILWNNIPVKMNAGKTYKAYVLIRNTGDLSWTAATNFKLGHTSSGALFGSNRYLIDDNTNEISVYGGIFSGRPIIFELTIVAPSNKGNYVTHWQMLREAVQWFGQELTVPITVYAGADLNQDNFVNFLDLAELASQWLQSGQSSGNLNADEIVNFKDFAIMAKDWLK